MSTNIIEICHKCKEAKQPLLRCGRCRAVKYCSRECQAGDWLAHKPQCSDYDRSKQREAKKNIFAILRNKKFNNLIPALSYHWNRNNTGHIRCIIKPDDNLNRGSKGEKFFDCELKFYNYKVADLREDLPSIEIMYLIYPETGGFFRATSGFAMKTCEEAYENLKTSIRFDQLCAKKINVTMSDIDFCAFSAGEMLISM